MFISIIDASHTHMAHGCFAHRTRLANASLSLSVNTGDINVCTLCCGPVHPQDDPQLCVEGGFAAAFFAKSRTKATMPVLVTGKATNGTALHEDGSVPKLSVI
jgi:hypothetical protein